MAVEKGDLSFVICPVTPDRDGTQSVSSSETLSPLMKPDDFIENQGRISISPQHGPVNQLLSPQQIILKSPHHRTDRADVLLPPTAFMPQASKATVRQAAAKESDGHLQQFGNKTE